jgi:hypothetical protein
MTTSQQNSELRKCSKNTQNCKVPHTADARILKQTHTSNAKGYKYNLYYL